MWMYVFKRIAQVSDHYHCEGGLAIVARDKQHAINIIDAMDNIEITEEEWERVDICELKHGAEEKVYVFPDAGCCDRS